MKEYHTKIEIAASTERVWKVLTDFSSYSQWNPLVSNLTGAISEGGFIRTTIVPLQNTYTAKLISYKTNKEIVWKGKQIASFLLAGEHYYRLSSENEHLSTLEHGEYFTGLLSVFLSKKQLAKMESAFIAHNSELKKRVENEK